MLCYKDMTFCSANCHTICPIKLTPQVEEAAAKWWGSSDAPIAVSNYSDTCQEYKEKLCLSATSETLIQQ